MTKAIDVVKAHQSTEPSQWKQQAQWHVDNWAWIKHSAQIAMKVKGRLKHWALHRKNWQKEWAAPSSTYPSFLKEKRILPWKPLLN